MANAQNWLTHVKAAAYPELGLVLRSDRGGSESDLVGRFVADLPWDVPAGSHLTVFEQPKLDSGFPDLVVVLWDTLAAAGWPDCRAALRRADIRVLHYLVSSGPCMSRELSRVFGSWFSGSIARLCAARAVYRHRGMWRAKRLNKIFAVREIVAFEAKMTAHSEALAQASRNRWFASHSYVILPKKPHGSWSLKKANQTGVGVWSHDGHGWACLVPSVVESIPRSYASWLFNEWVWRLTRSSNGDLCRS